MPILGSLVSWLGAQIVSVVLFLKGSAIAIRLQGLLFVATIYVSCVIAFSQFVGAWIAAVFATAYGALIGLLFPPISGTILAGLSAYWTCVIGVRYISSLTKAAIK